MNFRLPRLAAVAAALTLPLVAASCGTSDTPGSGASDGGSGEDKLAVVASFYPLAHAVERVGGERVEVNNLTREGQDPHHLELTPQQVATVQKADLVVYEKGMQPAADGAIEAAKPASALDLSVIADLPAAATQIVGDADHADEHADHAHDADHADADEHADDADHAADDGHDHGPNDPHFWLDPQRYAQAVEKVAQQLGAVDPAGAATYTANAQAFTKELTDLDGKLEAGLRTCAQRTIVTGHTAFGYLADRYKLNQVGLAGVLNEGEADPARIAEVVKYVKANRIATIYAEEGETQASLDTVAREAGVEVGTLDNLSITKEAGYVGRMEANLETLRAGQGCS